MNTQLGISAQKNINGFKNYASENQFNQMTEVIKNFDVDVTGFGFYAIQAKLKLKTIAELNLTEFQAICELFKK